MPIIKSAKKALKQSKKKNLLNSRYKRKFREHIKKYRELILGKKFEDAKKVLPLIFKSLDKAAKHGTIKKNTASRYKSRLSKKIPRSNEPQVSESSKPTANETPA